MGSFAFSANLRQKVADGRRSSGHTEANLPPKISLAQPLLFTSIAM